MSSSVGKNSFDILGITPTYFVSKELLQKHYHDKLKVLHPDHAIDTKALNQTRLLESVAAVNSAYQVLKDDFSRAAAYLEFTFSRSFYVKNENQTIENPQLLMELMEYEEELADCSLENLPLLLDKIRQISIETQSTVENLLRSYIEAPGSHLDIASVQFAMLRWQMVRKLYKKVEQATLFSS